MKTKSTTPTLSQLTQSRKLRVINPATGCVFTVVLRLVHGLHGIKIIPSTKSQADSQNPFVTKSRVIGETDLTTWLSTLRLVN